VRFYFIGTEFLYEYDANLSKAVAAKRLPLTILCRDKILRKFKGSIKLSKLFLTSFV